VIVQKIWIYKEHRIETLRIHSISNRDMKEVECTKGIGQQTLQLVETEQFKCLIGNSQRREIRGYEI